MFRGLKKKVNDIHIDYLKNHSHHIPLLAQWAFGAWGRYNQNSSLERITKRFHEHLNDHSLPLTLIALDNETPVGMCSLRITDGIRPELTPWLGSLYVDEPYRKRGIGLQLIKTIIHKLQVMGYKGLNLLAHDSALVRWYEKLGWTLVETDQLNGHPVSIMKLIQQ